MKIDVKEFTKECGCGRTHDIRVKDIIIEQGAIQRLPELLSRGDYFQYQHMAIICDDNTYLAAGAAVLKGLPQSSCITLSPDGLHANEQAVAAVMRQLPAEIDLILAVGSGTIHDITRYIANEKGIPFVSVPTAASVDGFVSTVAAMTWEGYKQTFPAVSPICVVADSSIFAKAPYRLTASGVSDLLGKYIALADWKIAHIVTGEYICERVCNLEYQALKKVSLNLEAIRSGKIDACEQLMYALLLSGIAMQMIGNSRPASGAEHHFSHLWEMEAIHPHIDAYHGEKVSVGLRIAVSVYHQAEKELMAGNFKLNPNPGIETELLKNAIASEKLYRQIIEENTPDPLCAVNTGSLRSKIPEIVKVLQELPSVQSIEEMLTAAGCAKSLQDIGLPENVLQSSIRISPYVRSRLTFMRILKLFQFDKNWEIDTLLPIADKKE